MMTEKLTPTKSRIPSLYDPPTILELVGNTPLLALNKIEPNLSDKVTIYAKPEWFNPSGSSKDRPASRIIRSAIASGELSPGVALLDSTSGNMGIAYATFGKALGIPVHLAIPSNASPRRMKILNALGAQLTLTDPSEGTDGARLVVEEMYAKDPEHYFLANQYKNPENWKSHYYSTGPEILAQTGGCITHFVAGLGTSGTMMGTGRYLREQCSEVRLIAVQPDGPLHGLEGLKHMMTSPNPEIYDPGVPDEISIVVTEDAHWMATELARQEGLLVGTSAAAAVVAATRIARQVDEGLIVVLLPDSAEKYFDLPYWSEV
jgi:cysteine synthase B